MKIEIVVVLADGADRSHYRVALDPVADQFRESMLSRAFEEVKALLPAPRVPAVAPELEAALYLADDWRRYAEAAQVAFVGWPAADFDGLDPDAFERELLARRDALERVRRRYASPG